MSKNEKRIKLGGIILCELFTVFTIIMLLRSGETDRLGLTFGTLLLVMLPMLLEKMFCCRLSLPLYLFALVYAIGPMLWLDRRKAPWIQNIKIGIKAETEGV